MDYWTNEEKRHSIEEAEYLRRWEEARRKLEEEPLNSGDWQAIVEFIPDKKWQAIGSDHELIGMAMIEAKDRYLDSLTDQELSND
jgi:hypothetical protein